MAATTALLIASASTFTSIMGCSPDSSVLKKTGGRGLHPQVNGPSILEPASVFAASGFKRLLPGNARGGRGCIRTPCQRVGAATLLGMAPSAVFRVCHEDAFTFSTHFSHVAWLPSSRPIPLMPQTVVT